MAAARCVCVLMLHIWQPGVDRSQTETADTGGVSCQGTQVPRGRGTAFAFSKGGATIGGAIIMLHLQGKNSNIL